MDALDYQSAKCQNLFMSERIEPKADRMTWMIFIIYLVISLIVLATTRQMDLAAGAGPDKVKAIWIDEVTSHLTILPAVMLIPFWLSRFPISLDNWVSRIPIYLLCFLMFSALHVLAMIGIRKLVYPMIVSCSYDTSLLSAKVWIYEMRKDFMAFVMILGTFLMSRLLFQLKLEAEAARKEARTTGRMTLKSGGRMLFLNADEILFVKAAGNYAEVHTDDGMHLVRITMSAIESLLNEQDQHLRVHRSYIVRKNAISEMKPNGEGEAIIFVPNQVQIPVSRNYRSGVTEALGR